MEECVEKVAHRQPEMPATPRQLLGRRPRLPHPTRVLPRRQPRQRRELARRHQHPRVLDADAPPGRDVQRQHPDVRPRAGRGRVRGDQLVDHRRWGLHRRGLHSEMARFTQLTLTLASDSCSPFPLNSCPHFRAANLARAHQVERQAAVCIRLGRAVRVERQSLECRRPVPAKERLPEQAGSAAVALLALDPPAPTVQQQDEPGRQMKGGGGETCARCQAPQLKHRNSAASAAAAPAAAADADGDGRNYANSTNGGRTAWDPIGRLASRR